MVQSALSAGAIIIGTDSFFKNKKEDIKPGCR